MRIRFFAIAALLSVSAQAETASPFQQLLDDHWNWIMANNPVYATTLGDRRFDDRLADLTTETSDRQTKDMKAFLQRLDAIPASTLPEADQLNHAILQRDLRESIEARSFPQQLMLFTNRSGWHSGFAGLPDDLPFYTLADYQSYVARLKAYPQMNADGITTTRKAIKAGMTQPCESMRGFDESITKHVVKDVNSSVFWRPFDRKPAVISDADWSRLKAEAAQAITTGIIPAYAQFGAFYAKEYQPKCRRSVSISAMPKGAAYYAYRVRTETTTDLSPAQIHQIGLDEVARIQKEMDGVVLKAGFSGSRADYIARLRTDPVYYTRSGDDLLLQTAALMKRIDGEMPRYFGRLPRLPYTVKPIPDAIAPGNTTAYYEPGAAQTGRAAVYRVNTTELNQRPLYELPSLSLHEAVPGHHHQIALQQELALPNFRKHAVFFTAFVEGWGLYAERLGIEMGLYDTPEKDFGRLSYEMWRACRLVVDTGLHAKGWSKAQAIDFMTQNTALSKANIEAEVNRYISWPGQALAYKIGELKIRALRTQAEQRLGSRFDLRAFHDAVLENGAVPLSVLDSHVNAWISKQEKAQ